MTLLPTPNTDYTDKDFDALRTRLYALVESVFPEWTDHNVANFGNILLELHAFVGDVLTYYQDNQARESRIVTATQRRSLIGLCKLISYDILTASAATADLTLSIASVSPANVEIPAGTIIKTADITDPVEFQTESAATITAGSLSTTGTAKNSGAAQDTFTSSGLSNQGISLSSTPYLDETAIVVASNGTFTEVASFLDSGPTSKHYTVVVDQNDRATIRFGNGTVGVIPTGTIVVDYEVGGGVSGNVEAGAINRIPGTWTDTLGNAVALSVTNPAAASGGADRQTNAQIKDFAPLSLRTGINSVTKEDFEVNALRVPGVARALMATSNEDSSIPENSGILYPIPDTGDLPSTSLKADVLTMVTVTYPPTLTFQVLVQDPSYKTVDVTATVYLAQGYSQETVRGNIEEALEAFFAPVDSDGTPNPKVDFGANMLDVDGVVVAELAWSDVHNEVRDALGVRKTDASTSGFLLNGIRADVSLAAREFPKLGTITLYDGDTGDTF